MGLGYGDDKNDVMVVIIDDKIILNFCDGDYFCGFECGVDVIVYEVSGIWSGEFNILFLECFWNWIVWGW